MNTTNAELPGSISVRDHTKIIYINENDLFRQINEINNSQSGNDIINIPSSSIGSLNH